MLARHLLGRAPLSKSFVHDTKCGRRWWCISRILNNKYGKFNENFHLFPPCFSPVHLYCVCACDSERTFQHLSSARYHSYWLSVQIQSIFHITNQSFIINSVEKQVIMSLSYLVCFISRTLTIPLSSRCTANSMAIYFGFARTYDETGRQRERQGKVMVVKTKKKKRIRKKRTERKMWIVRKTTTKTTAKDEEPQKP